MTAKKFLLPRLHNKQKHYSAEQNQHAIHSPIQFCPFSTHVYCRRQLWLDGVASFPAGRPSVGRKSASTFAKGSTFPLYLWLGCSRYQISTLLHKSYGIAFWTTINTKTGFRTLWKVKSTKKKSTLMDERTSTSAWSQETSSSNSTFLSKLCTLHSTTYWLGLWIAPRRVISKRVLVRGTSFLTPTTPTRPECCTTNRSPFIAGCHYLYRKPLITLPERVQLVGWRNIVNPISSILLYFNLCMLDQLVELHLLYSQRVDMAVASRRITGLNKSFFPVDTERTV